MRQRERERGFIEREGGGEKGKWEKESRKGGGGRKR